MSRAAFWGSLAALVGLGALLRIAGITHQSLWIDEIASLSMAQDGLWEAFPRLREDAHPPLYFLLLGFWKSYFGSSEAAARSLSVIPSLASIALMARLGTRLYGPRAGLVAAGLASVSLLQIYYAQEVRSYAWFICFGLLSSDALVRWRLDERAGSLVSYGVWTTATLYTHYFGFFLLAAQALFMVTLALRGRTAIDIRSRLFVGWGLATLASGVLFLPWLPIFLEQIKGVQQGFWIDAPTLSDLLAVPLLFLSCIGPWGPREGVPGHAYGSVAGPVVLAFVGLAVLLSVVWAWQARTRSAPNNPLLDSKRLPREESVLLLWLWFVVPPVIGFALSGFGLDVFTFRNTVISAPALLLLFAGLTRRLENPLVCGVLLAALVAPSVGQFPMYYGELHKDPWREVAAQIGSDYNARQDAIVFDARFIHLGFDRYSPLASYREVDIFGPAPQDVERVWLVRAYAGPKSRSPEFITRWGFLPAERRDFLHIELHRFDRGRGAEENTPE